MQEKSVDEVYAANAAVRARLTGVIASLSDEQLTRVPDGEKWSIVNIVEHLSMVEASAIRICGKLLEKAEADGKTGDGKITMTNNFIEKGIEVAGLKLEAPEIVQPTGAVSISESMTALDENFDSLERLKPLFKTVDSAERTFPHPYFGGLSAGEWLSLIGAHEARHLRQIKALIESK